MAAQSASEPWSQDVAAWGNLKAGRQPKTGAACKPLVLLQPASDATGWQLRQGCLQASLCRLPDTSPVGGGGRERGGLFENQLLSLPLPLEMGGRKSRALQDSGAPHRPDSILKFIPETQRSCCLKEQILC